MWVGTITMSREKIEDVRKICTDIGNRDSTFKWEIDDKNNLLITHENNKSLVYKRVIWFINKVKPLEGCKFAVKWSKV